MKEIIAITTYPPRECGIATFSDDLIRAIHHKFGDSYAISVCALESKTEKHTYTDTVKYILNTSESSSYAAIAEQVNHEAKADLILIEHEFGLFAEHEDDFLQLVKTISKPVVIVFHTVLSNPTPALQQNISQLTDACTAIIVMTQTSSLILQNEYQVDKKKLSVIPHGTHLVLHKDKKRLKEKYNVTGRKILTTFGLLSSGKGIGTTLDALPSIIKEDPTVLFLIIGKTHPTVVKSEGEAYREALQAKIATLNLTENVRLVNSYLELPVLLEYLQLTDIYLFTSCNPHQAVSGTFVYALSCGCPIISTPIPHALELLKDNSGILFDFRDAEQLAKATNKLLTSDSQRSRMKIAGLQKTTATAWENSAIAHVLLFEEILQREESLYYSLPPINIEHIKRMSLNFAMIQFCHGNRPDLKTGYTLDDNARALMVLCQFYAKTENESCKKYIKRYLDFIKYCLQPDGSFLNYVDKKMAFTSQNQEVGLEDSNGRAIWALGCFLYYAPKLPAEWTTEATLIFNKACPLLQQMNSPRSIAFAIKGLYYYNQRFPSPEIVSQIVSLADKLVYFYDQSSSPQWHWFEAYLTYNNSTLSESMLYAYLATDCPRYKEVAKESFEFLLTKVFTNDRIKVISNQGWLLKENEKGHSFGEQPIDVSDTVTTLALFHTVFHKKRYLTLQRNAFNWFLGYNHLHQIIYNPVTGGCYDGLEESNVSINQGAESTVCYLAARLSLLSPIPSPIGE